MKLKILLTIAIIGLGAIPAAAQNSLAQKLSGRILLQVESRGQTWYVNPADQKRYFLGRPLDAFNVMRTLGIGITDSDLAKIPIEGDKDAILSTTNLNAGKIFLQVQSLGQAWYVSPIKNKRYYLGRPQDAWQIMRSLALGITNKNLEQIAVGRLEPNVPPDQPPVMPSPNAPPDQESVLNQAAANIRNNNAAKTKTFFIETMAKAIEYTMNFLNAESKFLLANILSGAKLTSSTATEKIYSTTVYFSLGGYEVPLNFHVKKQADGQWLMTNL